MEGTFTVKTTAFEGPLDLLLQLIEKRKVFVNDISLSQVADDYISHIQELGTFPIEKTAHFILVASTLLLIKSKSLLPSIPLTEEEQGSVEHLEARLKLYQRIQEVSKQVGTIFLRSPIFFRTPTKQREPVFSPEEGMTVASLREAMGHTLASLPKEEVLPKTVVRKVVSLDEMIKRLTERIQTSLKMSFSDLARSEGSAHGAGARQKVSKEDKAAVIISFLAMLELVKQGIVEVYQNHFSEDISIETKDVGVPNYH